MAFGPKNVIWLKLEEGDFVFYNVATLFCIHVYMKLGCMHGYIAVVTGYLFLIPLWSRAESFF